MNFNVHCIGSGLSEISVDEIALSAKTINYEIVSLLATRLPRFYSSGLPSTIG